MQAALLELPAAATRTGVVSANLHRTLNPKVSKDIIEDSVGSGAVKLRRAAKPVKALSGVRSYGAQPQFHLRVLDVTQDAQVDLVRRERLPDNVYRLSRTEVNQTENKKTVQCRTVGFKLFQSPDKYAGADGTNIRMILGHAHQAGGNGNAADLLDIVVCWELFVSWDRGRADPRKKPRLSTVSVKTL